MSSFIDDSSKDDGSKDENEEATAGIEIKFLGNKLRPFIFFNSMGELMSLYWSGASEERTSALQVRFFLKNFFKYSKNFFFDRFEPLSHYISIILKRFTRMLNAKTFR
jgi:hypothetical protein